MTGRKKEAVPLYTWDVSYPWAMECDDQYDEESVSEPGELTMQADLLLGEGPNNPM